MIEDTSELGEDADDMTEAIDQRPTRRNAEVVGNQTNPGEPTRNALWKAKRCVTRSDAGLRGFPNQQLSAPPYLALGRNGTVWLLPTAGPDHRF